MGGGVANVLKAIVEEKVGKKAVGDGECFALVDMALKSAGAKSAEDFGKVTLHSDYVWGHAVDLDRIRPGDVLQFRNHVVKVHTETDPSWQERTYTRPHHTAVVVAVEGDGSVIVVEQKVKPDPKKVTRNVIARLAQGTETRPGTLEQNGVLRDAKITITSNNSSPSLIVTLTPTGCMMPWSKLGGVLQVYIKFLHERLSAFPLALTLYHIYIYQHKTCSTSRRMRYKVSLVIMCRNFVYISAALWRIDTTT